MRKNYSRRAYLLLIPLTLIGACSLFAQSQLQLPLVPYPNSVVKQKGTFVLPATLTVFVEADPAGQLSFTRLLLEDLKKYWAVNAVLSSQQETALLRVVTKGKDPLSKPGYELNVTSEGIMIKASNWEGAFHASRTLLQLLQKNNSGAWESAAVFIEDFPRFSYRGMHLDVGRHFYPVPVIKQYIDWLAYHKLNKFHWHLTEDQGWRIEIKQFPLLTRVGGWRNGTIIGRYPGKGNDNTPHGGFYSQAEIREVVSYAQERFIEVIPEIEMPGHSSAAIAAYPWLSCFPEKPTMIPEHMISQASAQIQQKGGLKLVQETWGVFDDVFCAGNDSTFVFLEKVIDEVSALFPSTYFHIGGDECPKTHWKICSRCQERIKALGLKDEHELQSYFVRRIENYLSKKGKILIGWDEILEGGLAPNAVVMSWRGEAGGIVAAKEKHEVIMTPGNPVYFDHSQSENEDSITIGGYNPLEKVYQYDPVPAALAGGFEKYVLGTQANVWTEYMATPEKIQYMIFPRIAALSEVCWTVPSQKSWSTFEKRLPLIMERYTKAGVQISSAYYDIKASVLPKSDHSGLELSLSSKAPGTQLQWIQDNTLLSYTGPRALVKSGSVKAQSMDTLTGIVKSRYEQLFYLHKASGKKISLLNEPSTSYPGEGAFTLVNGVKANKGFGRTSDYLGFSGNDAGAVIDLGSLTDIHSVEISFLEQPESWIYPPSSIEIYGSPDGNQFKKAASMELKNENFSIPEMKLKELKINSKYRFIKVIVKNFGSIPEGRAGAGKPAWLFVDEISVY